MTDLLLYNSLTRATAPFVPIDPENVRVYSCGPTVYNYAHIGNLRAYVFTDTLARVLAWKAAECDWGKLTHVINITDVGHLTSDADAGDDKMEAAARARGTSIWGIAAHYTAAFKQNLTDLNIRAPTHFPLATDHIAEMIGFGERIADKHCYRLQSGLYFDVSTVPDYGHLARTVDDAGESRIEPVDGKRNPQDFAIWRTSQPGENRQMEWDSPWGRGAPGWHLECSVMSRKYLGDHFDIHTGGIDHREIHHPNEIAQNQAYCDCADTGAQIWMHNNFLVERSGKMSKSGGGFTTLQTLVDAGFHPLAYRMMCLQAHYRSEMEFNWEGLAAAFTRLKRIVMKIEALESRGLVDAGRVPGVDPWFPVRRFEAEFDDAISNDLNTPKALAVLESLLDAQAHIAPILAKVREFDTVLGLKLYTSTAMNHVPLTRADLRIRPTSAILDEADIETRLAERRESRAAKDFARSDAIRDELTAAGVEVMDGDPLGWDWRIAP